MTSQSVGKQSVKVVRNTFRLRHINVKNGEYAVYLKYLVPILVKKLYKIQHLEGSGTPFLYIGRKVFKG
jgi:hypothetical protein